jgi:ribosomal protein L16 Arg81 hydroxylase
MKQNLIIDPDKFKIDYPEKPVAVKHNLADHPLFAVDRLLEVQNEIPSKKVDWYTGKVGVNTDRIKTDPTGLSAEETIRQIKECESWLVLKNVEVIQEYRQLLEDCFAPYRSIIESRTPGMRQLEAWIFITSPGSIAPYHIDPEHNFLLQVHGPKVIHIFDANDPEIVSDLELENFYNSGGEIAKLEYDEQYQQKVKSYVMQPGDGIYIPYVAPHWVKVEGDFSISFSVSFYSTVCDNKARLYRFNSRMRKLGLTPSSPGAKPGRDAAKISFISAYLKAQNIFRRDNQSGRAY